MKYDISPQGFYGAYGGAYIPEMLYPCVEELRANYLSILKSSSFVSTFKELLHTYAGRPTPLYHAKTLSKKYNNTILFKREDLCHTGAHKINNALGQILIARKMGKTRVIAETGAGQHGVATATVCAMMNMKCVIYMGALDMQRQAPNVSRIKMLGAEIRAVHSGSKTLKDATNEAIRDWINHVQDTYYIIGSVVGPHPYPDIVSRLQSVISQEIKEQLTDQFQRDTPDIIVACVGGGSNAMGAFYHFLPSTKTELIAVEAAGEGIATNNTAATTFCGSPGILHGSKTLLMQDENGQIIEPHSISAGLDYPGIGPFFAHLKSTRRATFIPITNQEALQAALQCTESEGIIPALETAHAIAALEKIDEKERCIVINISGRGDKDLATYMDAFNLV